MTSIPLQLQLTRIAHEWSANKRFSGKNASRISNSKGVGGDRPVKKGDESPAAQVD